MKFEIMPEFVVIDDDYTNNLICNEFIKLVIPDASVTTFTHPERGIEYIETNCAGDDRKPIILFLDINMPTLTGWEVLETIALFPESVKEHLKIFMLSSSVNPKDKELADANPLVSGYVSKALSEDKLYEIFSRHPECLAR